MLNLSLHWNFIWQMSYSTLLIRHSTSIAWPYWKRFFIVFLDRTEYGLVAWMIHRIKCGTGVKMMYCIETTLTIQQVCTILDCMLVEGRGWMLCMTYNSSWRMLQRMTYNFSWIAWYRMIYNSNQRTLNKYDIQFWLMIRKPFDIWSVDEDIVAGGIGSMKV